MAYYVSGNTLPEAYHEALLKLYLFGDKVPCPDYKTYISEIPIMMFVKQADAEPLISRLFPGGHHELQQYVMEICDGILDFMVGAADNVWEYTYHQRFEQQLPWLLNEIRRNPYTRRAVLNIRDFDVDSNNDHPACLQHMQFTVRDNKLNMTVLMRSNDAVEATFMNAIGFIFLQKKIADNLGIPVGSYTHIANSFHVYEKDNDKLESYIKAIRSKSLKNITYNYKGFYDLLMNEEIPAIMSMVQSQKEKYNIK